jgi:hypothetical protein
MKRLLITALCLLLITTISSGQKRAKQAEWKFVELLANSEALYIHTRKKLTRSGTIKIWTKVEDALDLTGIERVGEPSFAPPSYSENSEWERDKLHSKTLYEFNCKEEMLRINYVIEYKKGKVITSEQRKEAWKDVVPDSIGEALFKAACKK